MDEPTLIKNNSAKLAKDITESGKAEVSPSCMDAHSSDPEPSFISRQSSGQNIDNPNPPQGADSCHENKEETLQQVLDRAHESRL